MTAQTKGSRRFLIAASVVAGIIILGLVVDLRLGAVQMPLKDMMNVAPSFGTPSELSKRTAGSRATGGRGSAEALPILEDFMPEFRDIALWLNSEPLTPASLKGKVVLIDFWTYSCINCIRTMPYVTAWHEKYKDKGFTVVGVHTPEFAFEKEEKNVREAIARHRITYPVPLDNDYGTWNNYSNRYWPAHYLFDAEGRLRFVHFGEGKYDETERNIQSLLAEAGTKAELAVTEMPSAVDFEKIGTRETYLGYEREEYFGSPERVVRGGAQTYSAAAEPERNLYYLVGRWIVEGERSVLAGTAGSIVYRYHASNANLVMGAPDGGVEAEVTIDGTPVPEALRGADVAERDGKTYVRVREQRLYNLIDAKGDYRTRLLRIDFQGKDVEAYAFTFG